MAKHERETRIKAGIAGKVMAQSWTAGVIMPDSEADSIATAAMHAIADAGYAIVSRDPSQAVVDAIASALALYLEQIEDLGIGKEIEHSGDCIKEPWACDACMRDGYLEAARVAVAAMQGGAIP